MAEKKKRFPLGCIFLSVGFTLVLFVIVGFVGLAFLQAFRYSLSEKIAHIDVEGVITSAPQASVFGSSSSMVRRVSQTLKRAREDDSVRAVVLRVNSPGGEVTAADTIYHHVKKTAKVKPVIIFMDSMAASGGFYIACAGTEIVANRTTMTGSIGVIISTLNYSEVLQKVGLEALTFTSGKFKDSLSGTRPMRPDERDLIQSMVLQTYERFLEVVKEARPDIPDGKLRNSIADGRIISGQDALSQGLIDQTGYLEDAYARARELANAPNAKVIRFSEETSLGEALGLMKAKLFGQPAAEVELRIPGLPTTELQPGVPYLLPPTYAP